MTDQRRDDGPRRIARQVRMSPYDLPELDWHRIEANPLRIQASEHGVLYELVHVDVDDVQFVLHVTAASGTEIDDEQFATIAGAMNWIDEQRLKRHEEVTRKVSGQ